MATKWYPVEMTMPWGEIYQDAIRGNSPEDALKNAVWNWETASNIRLLEG